MLYAQLRECADDFFAFAGRLSRRLTFRRGASPLYGYLEARLIGEMPFVCVARVCLFPKGRTHLHYHMHHGTTGEDGVVFVADPGQQQHRPDTEPATAPCQYAPAVEGTAPVRRPADVPLRLPPA